MKEFKIVFLGTNGWYDTDTGNTICILVETPKEYLILDAGTGIYKADRYITKQKPIYLFISHFHLDHVIGLHILAKFSFKQTFAFCVGKWQLGNLNRILSREFTMPLKEIPFPTKIIEIKDKNKGVPFLEKALVLKHPVPSFGFRFNFKGKILTYIPDSGPCNNADKLAKNADMLITDCAFAPGQTSDLWPHLNPETAALLAKRSGAKKLILAHFDAEVYKTLKQRKVAEQYAQSIFKNTVAAADGMKL